MRYPVYKAQESSYVYRQPVWSLILMSDLLEPSSTARVIRACKRSV